VKVLKRKPMRVSEFEAYLAELQAYLRGEDVEVDGATTSMARMYDIDPSLRITKPLVDVAATGPRTVEVAARTADGVSFSVGADVERLRRSVELVRDTCERSGRRFESLRLGCYLQVAVTDEDRSAREAIRGLVVTHARFSGWEPRPTADVSEQAHTTYRHALETMESVYHSSRGGVAVREGGRPGEIDFYPHEAGGDELIDQFAIAGSAESCAEQLQEIIDLGITRVLSGTRAVGVDLDESNAIRIGREVLPLLRR
jgi:5,10-methylenetetrahydromethanopterin reductase